MNLCGPVKIEVDVEAEVAHRVLGGEKSQVVCGRGGGEGGEEVTGSWAWVEGSGGPCEGGAEWGAITVATYDVGFVCVETKVVRLEEIVGGCVEECECAEGAGYDAGVITVAAGCHSGRGGWVWAGLRGGEGETVSLGDASVGAV